LAGTVRFFLRRKQGDLWAAKLKKWVMTKQRFTLLFNLSECTEKLDLERRQRQLLAGLLSLRDQRNK
jgi:hypothetical protein